MIQNKLKSIEDTICWINQEEALFKFPQSSYPDVGDVNVIREPWKEFVEKQIL
jgi:hypothetical protein